MKRIQIITGHYGSGKTEYAVNLALQLAGTGRKTALADLDIVNGNPLEDIKLLADADNIGLVMIGGDVKKNIL